MPSSEIIINGDRKIGHRRDPSSSSPALCLAPSLSSYTRSPVRSVPSSSTSSANAVAAASCTTASHAARSRRRRDQTRLIPGAVKCCAVLVGPSHAHRPQATHACPETCSSAKRRARPPCDTLVGAAPWHARGRLKTRLPALACIAGCTSHPAAWVFFICVVYIGWYVASYPITWPS